MRRLHVLLTIVLLVVVLATTPGCTKKGRALDETAWRLEGWSVNSVSATAFPITAQFADGQISGVSAVNQYSGPYTANPDGSFLVGQLTSTLMAGSDAANRAEMAYTRLLTGTRRYKREGKGLTLFDENGTMSLVFSQTE